MSDEQNPVGDYFANQPVDQIGNRLIEKVDQFYRYLDQSGELIRMARSYRAYYGKSSTWSGANSQTITRSGKHAQLSLVKVNHYRNIVQHTLQLTTSQKPAPQPIASNSDAKSHEQATLASGLCEYYGREKRIDRLLYRAAEHALLLSEGYVESGWDANAGEKDGFNPETGQELRQGDAFFRNVLPVDLVKDPWKESHEDLDWVVVRDFQNKYEMAAKWAGPNQELADSIVGLPGKTEDYLHFTLRRFGPNYLAGMPTDDVPIYRFYHRKTNAVPDGRMTVFCEGGLVLFDGPLPYKDIPVRRICPSDYVGTPFGYTPMYDLLVLQECIDALYSAVVTNQLTFGVQLIMALKGSSIDFKQLSKGLAFIEYSHPQGKPEPLNLTHTPAEIFAFIKQLEGAMETISGINSTVRGNPDASLKSGSALALIQSQAIQFSIGLQQSYAQLVEDVYTDLLNILKEYANTPRTVAIVGSHNRYMLKDFSSESLSSVNRVVVDSGSALSQTTAGRMQIAQDLLNSRLITTPEEYIGVITTGRLDSMLEGDNRELINIKQENESMANAQQVLVAPIDKHSLHIREHRAVLASIDARNNPQVIQAVSQHIQQHVQVLADPAMANLLLILGEHPISMPPPTPEEAAGGTPKGGSGPSAMSAPAPIQGGPAPLEPNNPPPRPAKMPNMPVNKSTGQRWDPNTGGGVVQPMSKAVPG